jgi:hypothetical protein
MKRSLLLVAAVFLAGASALHAQQVSNDANPLYRPTIIRLGTITVPPITGVPFSATALIENQQMMPDGSVAASRNINLIGRDSRGRTHGEMRSRVPASSSDIPHLGEVHIYDPQTHLITIYYPATHIATQQLEYRPMNSNLGKIPDPQVAEALDPATVRNMAITDTRFPPKPTTARIPQFPLPPTGIPVNPLAPRVKIDDLGTTTINDFDVKGTRRTVVIPAQANGTGAPITVVDEYWYSEDLHVNVLLRHHDPRTGLQTIALSDIKREDPPQSFFAIPEGYKIVDMTPPPDAPVVLAPAGGQG